MFGKACENYKGTENKAAGTNERVYPEKGIILCVPSARFCILIDLPLITPYMFAYEWYHKNEMKLLKKEIDLEHQVMLQFIEYFVENDCFQKNT